MKAKPKLDTEESREFWKFVSGVRGKVAGRGRPLVSVESGGDWYDASYTVLRLQTSKSKEELAALYNQHIDDMRVLREAKRQGILETDEVFPYESFASWMINEGFAVAEDLDYWYEEDIL